MFDWVPLLFRNNQDDFWLNVFAGVPFLLFEVVVITVSLPFALQWRDERHWLKTRLDAIQRLLGQYGAVDDRIRELLEQDATEHGQVYDALKSHLERVESALQTALPILNPEMSREILQLHHDWSAFVDSFRTNEFRLFGSEGVSRIGYLTYRTNDLDIQHRVLKVRYAVSLMELNFTCIRTRSPFEDFGELLAKVEREVYQRYGREPSEDLQVYVDHGRAARRYLLLDAKPIRPLIHKGWLGRLRWPKKTALYAPSADERDRMLREYDELNGLVSATYVDQVSKLASRRAVEKETLQA
ncbi:MAG: hypothetical protein EON87_08320 [Brevundimonas sp.]|nr:MAG: hypothetical protein EON87_08320 [Brevundimonas sp.]